MAKPRFTPRFTLRLSPSLREDLRCEAAAKGDDFADLIRNILAEPSPADRPSARPTKAGQRT
jgi:hypothetical protein